MNNIYIRDAMYRRILLPLLFRCNAEDAHNYALQTLSLLSNESLSSLLALPFYYSDPRLAITLAGLHFDNPICLAAGLDKNGIAIPALAALGFGALEIGSVTAAAQPGNPLPRMFRLPEDQAIINRMGFPSRGAQLVAEKLLPIKNRIRRTVIGMNLGKTKLTPLDQAEQDYCLSYRTLYDCADYFVINVSSPNTPDLRKLQEKDRLSRLIRAILADNKANKPLFVKVAPDLTDQELDDILEVCLETSIAGIIATNTTLSRDQLQLPSSEQGGLSGKPLRSMSLAMVRKIRDRTKGQFPIIGVGGISSVEDVVAMLRAGASVVQIYTALVYEGPFIVKKLKQQLVEYLEREKIAALSEIIGSDKA